MSFITAMIVMAVSALLYERFQRISLEVAVGCGVLTLISLTVAIVVAPWQIQGLLLIGVLLVPAFTKVDLLS